MVPPRTLADWTMFPLEPDLRTHRRNRLKNIHEIADTRAKVCKDVRKPLENLEVYSRKVTALTGFELSKIIGRPGSIKSVKDAEPPRSLHDSVDRFVPYSLSTIQEMILYESLYAFMVPAEAMASAVTRSLQHVESGCKPGPDITDEANLGEQALRNLELDCDQFLWDRSISMRMIIAALEAANAEMKPYTEAMEAARVELYESSVAKCMAAIPKKRRKLLNTIVDKAMGAGEDGLAIGANAERSIYLKHRRDWKTLSHRVAFTEFISQVKLMQDVLKTIKVEMDGE